MKVVLLAGGVGSRLAEETEFRPKPMVQIGQHPILWHIMKGYEASGFNDFVIALGYKGEQIKRYFSDYRTLQGNLTVNLRTGRVERETATCENWLIDLVDTGESTNTGGRVRRLARYLTDTFLLTYGDGVSDVDVASVLAFHRSHGRLATLTAVRPPARFGHLELQGDAIAEFSEKPQIGEGWINGGFFVMEPQVLDYIEGDATNLAHAPLENLAKDGQLMAYRHEGFWQCMDTIRDRELLEALWASPKPPWKRW